MSKLTNKDNLDKLAKALDARAKASIKASVAEESARAQEVESTLQGQIESTQDMLGGKSIRYIAQNEYDQLTDAEKNDSTVAYFITDAEDVSHEHSNMEFLENLGARVITIGESSKDFDGSKNVDWTLNEIGAAPISHDHNDTYYTKTEIDAELETIQDDIDESVAEESARAQQIELTLQEQVESTQDMLGGKSIKYMAQNEYDQLTDTEKNDPTITYFITDAEDVSHEHSNLEFLENLGTRVITIGESSKDFDGASNIGWTLNEIGAAPISHNHDDVYYTESEIDNKLETIQDDMEASIAEESARAQQIETSLQEQVESTRDMLGGKAIRYLTQNEYDQLTDAEKNDPTVTYFITDAENASHEHSNLEFLENLKISTFTIGDSGKDFDGASNMTWTLNEIGAAPASHDHNDIYYTKTDIDTKVSDLQNEIDEDVKVVADELTDVNTTLTGYIGEAFGVLEEHQGRLNNHNARIENHNSRIGIIEGDGAGSIKYIVNDAVKKEEDRAKAEELALQAAIDGKADKGHAHDEYYTKTEIDAELAKKSDTDHTHDDIYYTQVEIDTQVTTLNNSIATAKSDAQAYADTKITALVNSAPEAMNTLNELAEAINSHQDVYEAYVAEVSSELTSKSDIGHNHDDVYYTDDEVDNKLADVQDDIDDMKASIAEESARAQEVENTLQEQVESTRNMFDGKSIKYITQDEYNQLTDTEKNDSTIAYFITDAEDLSHEHSNIEFLENLGIRTFTIGESGKEFNGTENMTWTLNEIGAAPVSHDHNDLYYTEAEVDTKLKDINDTINNKEIALNSNIQTLDNNKANKTYVDEKLKVVDAITLNGYSLWVGTSAELEAITERDPSTLYFEIDDDNDEEVVQVDVVNGVLQLTNDKYQKTNMLDGTTIVFPTVSRFTEIHLYFSAGVNMNLNFPDCKWRVEPNVEEGNYYEIVAVYNTMFWLVNVISYSDGYSGDGDTDSNKIIWFDNKEIYSNTGSMETHDGYISSDFISLEENKDYQITVLNNTDTEIHCYDDEKNYLSDLDVSVTDFGIRVYSLRKMFEMDDMDISNTKYIRIESEKNEYINATNANEKIIIEEIDTLEDNQVPLIILDDCTIGSNGDRNNSNGYISIQHIVLDNYFNYQFEFLGSDSTVNYYDEDKIFISRDKGENNDYFEGRQVVLNSDDFPEGTKYVRIRFKENDTITFENIHEYLKVTKTPVVSENVMPLNWIENTNLDGTNGEPFEIEGETITDFIEIDDLYYYSLTLENPSYFRIYHYDSNKSFISRTEEESYANAITVGNEVLEFPDGTKYIRLKSDTDRLKSDIDNEDTIDVVRERITLKKFLKEENFLYSFGLLSDVHIDNNHDANYEDKAMSDEDYRNALRFLEDEGANFIAYCGDMTNDYSDSLVNYQLLAECLKESHVPNYIIKGNHDAGTGGFDEYISDINHFTVPYNDDLFIFLGNGSSTGSNGGLSQDRVDYVRNVIENNPNRRLFLMYHQFIRGYGSGDGTGGLYPWDTIGDDPNNAIVNEFIELVTNTPNLIFCHGHSHLRFNLQDTCPTANYYHVDGECHDIHVPSCSKPRIVNASGELESYYEGSEGYKVDVYSDKVIFKAINFTTNSYMPEYNQVVNLAAVAAE